MDALNIDLGLMIWTWITFGVLLAILSRYAYRPLQRAMAERERRVRESLEAADKARDEARRIMEENESHLAEGRAETRRIVDEGRKIAEDIRREAESKAARHADHIVQQAREEIERETQRSIGELKTTVANLSVRIARQVIRENLDDSRHAELADEFVERIKEVHGGRR